MSVPMNLLEAFLNIHIPCTLGKYVDFGAFAGGRWAMLSQDMQTNSIIYFITNDFAYQI